MPALVIDSSLAASWCFPDERTDYTNAIIQAISAPLEAVAPRLWTCEVRSSVLMDYDASVSPTLTLWNSLSPSTDCPFGWPIRFLRRSVQLGPTIMG
jgi:hypothetical protein